MGKSQSKASREQLSDLQKATYYDKRELRRWDKMFHKTYPSGQLNEAQFVKLYEEFFPDGEPSEFATIVFNVFDQNKNGTIDFEEFVRALSVISRGSLNEKLRWAFDLYDINRDGTITYNEMLRFVRSIYRVSGLIMMDMDDTPEQRVKKIFRDMDRDQDTNLTFDEFVKGSMNELMIAQISQALLPDDSVARSAAPPF